MATVTPNFNWPVPTSTDLVKDGATAIEALGDSIDASLVDLKGGTTGQVLSKNSNTDMDFVWVTSDDANAIQNSIVDAKGDLIAATAADTPARLAVGTNGQVLTADSTAATGLAWATASGGSTNVAGKNGVLNSAFNVWQRGTSIAGSSGAYLYTADRWQTEASTSITVSRQATGDTTNLPFIQYCARAQRNSGSTATAGVILSQSFETINSIPFAGRTVTFSFYARKGANFSSTSNLLTANVTSGTGTDQNAFVGGFTGAAGVISEGATLTTTWQRFTYTATVGTTATQLAVQFLYTPTGTAGAADFYEVTGVQLEIAGSASAYSPNTSTYQAELAACQRYYYRSTTTNTYGRLTGYTPAAGATGIYLTVQPPVKPRVPITAVDYSTVALYDGTNVVATISSISLGDPSNDLNTVNIVCTGLTQFRPYAILANNSTAAYIGFSSEL